MAQPSRLYSIFLHAMLIALAASSFTLASQNRDLIAMQSADASPSAFEVGAPLAPFEVITADQDQPRVFQVGASERPQLLFFFNTRCGACRENQTHWRALYDTLGDSTDVLGVSLDNPAETAAYVERLGLPFPTVSASDPNALAETLGLTRIPETVRVGTDGTVTDAWLGVLTTGALAKLGKGV